MSCVYQTYPALLALSCLALPWLAPRPALHCPAWPCPALVSHALPCPALRHSNQPGLHARHKVKQHTTVCSMSRFCLKATHCQLKLVQAHIRHVTLQHSVPTATNFRALKETEQMNMGCMQAHIQLQHAYISVNCHKHQSTPSSKPNHHVLCAGQQQAPSYLRSVTCTTL